MDNLKDLASRLKADQLAELCAVLKFSFHDWLVSFLTREDLPPDRWLAVKEKKTIALDPIATLRLGWAVKNGRVRLIQGAKCSDPREVPLRWNVPCCETSRVPCKTYCFDYLWFGIGECEKCHTIYIVAYNEATRKEVKNRLSSAVTVYYDFRQQQYQFATHFMDNLRLLWEWMTYFPQDAKEFLLEKSELPPILALWDRLKRWIDRETMELEERNPLP